MTVHNSHKISVNDLSNGSKLTVVSSTTHVHSGSDLPAWLHEERDAHDEHNMENHPQINPIRQPTS